jgi:hypothetical protein
MTSKLLIALAAGAAALFVSSPSVNAAGSSQPTVERTAQMTQTAGRPKYRASRRKATRVYGYTQRRVGGYSYSASDVTNTYGLTRSLYGSVNAWRDPMVDRQTRSGPFDHDFFYDSGLGLRGGNSPMLR